MYFHNHLEWRKSRSLNGSYDKLEHRSNEIRIPVMQLRFTFRLIPLGNVKIFYPSSYELYNTTDFLLIFSFVLMPHQPSWLFNAKSIHEAEEQLYYLTLGYRVTGDRSVLLQSRSQAH